MAETRESKVLRGQATHRPPRAPQARFRLRNNAEKLQLSDSDESPPG
jgi:hypothetical protein